MRILLRLKSLFNHPKEEVTMINASTIQKKAITTLRNAAIINAVVEQTFVAPSADEVNAAVSEFVGHLTLNDEATVRQTCGDNFDKIAAAFADQSGVVAKSLADQVAADAKDDFTAEVQAYADHLQYKHSIDNGQDAVTEQSQQ